MRLGSTLVLHEKTKWSNIGYSLKMDGMLSNFIDHKNQLMNGDVPWRGARKKHNKFLGIIFSTLTNEGDLIMDWNYGTGI